MAINQNVAKEAHKHAADALADLTRMVRMMDFGDVPDEWTEIAIQAVRRAETVFMLLSGATDGEVDWRKMTGLEPCSWPVEEAMYGEWER